MSWQEEIAIRCEEELQQIKDQHIILWLISDGIDTVTGKWVKRQFKPIEFNDESLKDIVLKTLRRCRFMTPTDISEFLNGKISPQKVAALLRALELDGEVERTYRYNRIFYSAI